MKKTIILFLLLPIFLQAQNKSMFPLVVKALDKSKDTLEIHNIKKVLGNDYKHYNESFSYIPSINPLNPKKLKRFSSKFGRRFHPIQKKMKQHLGLDISSSMGSPIHAAASGIVLKTKISNVGYGNQVYIEHQHGYKTRYAHMYTFIVEQGSFIKKGQIIGFVGTSGSSTGPHLHFEILKNNKHIDPFPFCFLDI